MEQVSLIESVIAALSDLHSDSSVPRNVRTKIDFMIATLKQDSELSIKVNRCLSELDEISSDVNLQSYTRTQLWNVMSILEKCN
jgi:uncharacterized protein